MARILIVDDALCARLAAAFILRQADHHVSHACHGQEALDRLREESVDLIVSSLNTAEIGGLGLLPWLRAHPTCRRLPVLVLSERGDEAARRRARAAGADAVLTKPVISWQLTNAVAQLLRKRPSARITMR